jgi:2-methylaconitate cis-trans-isomerase PrpF
MHVDYLFGQVDVKTGRVDYSGSCGNMIAGVGLYSLLKGLTPAPTGDKI